MSDAPSHILQKLKEKTRSLRREVFCMYLALRHPRTPWYAKVLAVCVVAYALSPIDLIPDPIPVLGYLDDIIIVPAGVMLVRRLIPKDVMDECRANAARGVDINPAYRWAGGLIIGGVWLATLVGILYLAWAWWHA